MTLNMPPCGRGPIIFRMCPPFDKFQPCLQVLMRIVNLNLPFFLPSIPPLTSSHFTSVGKPGSSLAQFERDTWPELARLATSVVEAGVHFQNNVLHNRKKDASSAVGDWVNELMKLDPWFKDVVPNVCHSFLYMSSRLSTGSLRSSVPRHTCQRHPSRI